MIESFEEMASLEEVLHNFSKGFTSGFPIAFIEEMGQNIRLKALIGGKRKEDYFNIFLRRDGTKISVVIRGNDRGQNVIQVVKGGNQGCNYSGRELYGGLKSICQFHHSETQEYQLHS